MSTANTTGSAVFGASLPARLNSSPQKFSAIADKISSDIRVAIPGIIQSFNAAKQTVTVLPVIRDEPRVNGAPSVVAVPLLTDVPVQLVGAGEMIITVPVQAGDECLLVFCDRCIDTWFQSGGVQNEFEPRKHDISDAVAILCVNNQTNAVQDYSADSMQIRNLEGTVIIDIADDQITITAPTIQLTGENISISASNKVTIASGANDTSIDARTFLTHVHSGVASGGADSGPVV